MPDHSFAVPTKLVAFGAALSWVILTRDVISLWVPVLTGICYLGFQRRWHLVVSFTGYYLLLATLLVMIKRGAHLMVLPEFTVLLFWTLTPVVIVSWDLITTPPGTLAEFMSRHHLPSAAILGMLVVFRFFPTMKSELGAIGQSMRNRGLLAPSRLLRHPALSVEYVLVPLLLRSLQIADQLTISAIARSAEHPGRRGSLAGAHLTWRDGLWMAIWVGLTLAFLLPERLS